MQGRSLLHEEGFLLKLDVSLNDRDLFAAISPIDDENP
jgi:hypothetical protein